MARKGELFRSWKAGLDAAGYEVDWRVLTACDYGAPTFNQDGTVQYGDRLLKSIWPSPLGFAFQKLSSKGFGNPVPWKDGKNRGIKMSRPDGLDAYVTLLGIIRIVPPVGTNWKPPLPDYWNVKQNIPCFVRVL